MDALWRVLRPVLTTLLVSSATAIASYLVSLLRKELQKAGVELTAAQEERLRQVALDVVRAVEEWARQLAKANLPVTGEEKENRAVEMLLERFPTITAHSARTAIHAALPRLRADLTPAPAR